jgi:DNA polymerase-3 subunit gamma/tau
VPRAELEAEPRAEAAPRPATAEAAPQALAAYASFEDVVALISARRDARLLAEVERFVRLVAYAPGRIEFAPVEGAPPSLAADLGRRLTEWTGARWMVSVVSGGGAATLAETRRAEADALEARLREHPLVAAALAAFPGAELSVAPAPSAGAAAEAPPAPEEPPDDEDWADWEPVDPFDED